ncbi:unnamed protein product [Adineta steineri]|uniref:Uncharacterized protein n=1 Tax=Adineta steineri TaxID=433720 RepID=A0A814CJK0_9BILA|nr:unnamed protein product [Adineta steineri]
MQINRHAVTILIIFGTVGNILNICVLTENTLRKIPCAIYLSWSSVSALVFIWSGLLTRVLQGRSHCIPLLKHLAKRQAEQKRRVSTVILQSPLPSQWKAV